MASLSKKKKSKSEKKKAYRIQYDLRIIFSLQKFNFNVSWSHQAGQPRTKAVTIFFKFLDISSNWIHLEKCVANEKCYQMTRTKNKARELVEYE